MGVTEVLCSFRLVLEGKTGKEITKFSHCSEDPFTDWGELHGLIQKLSFDSSCDIHWVTKGHTEEWAYQE